MNKYAKEDFIVAGLVSNEEALDLRIITSVAKTGVYYLNLETMQQRWKDEEKQQKE